jgi:hypothetical protein
VLTKAPACPRLIGSHTKKHTLGFEGAGERDGTICYNKLKQQYLGGTAARAPRDPSGLHAKQQVTFNLLEFPIFGTVVLLSAPPRPLLASLPSVTNIEQPASGDGNSIAHPASTCHADPH